VPAELDELAEGKYGAKDYAQLCYAGQVLSR
jgi:hypothetical protein